MWVSYDMHNTQDAYLEGSHVSMERECTENVPSCHVQELTLMHTGFQGMYSDRTYHQGFPWSASYW